MGNFSFAGLRVRLLLIVLLGLVPAVALSVLFSLEEHRRAVREIREDAAHLVREIASKQAAIMENDRELLALAARVSSSESGTELPEYSLPEAILKGFERRGRPLALCAPDGRLLAGSFPPEICRTIVNDLSTGSSQTRGCSPGYYRVLKGTGSPVFAFIHPICDENRRLPAAAFAALPIPLPDAPSRGAWPQGLREGSVLTVRDSFGVFLTRSVTGENAVTTAVDGLPAIEAGLEERGEGAVEAVGVDGVPRLIAFAALRGGDRGRPFVSIRIPVSEAFQSAEAVFDFQLRAIGLLAAVVLFITWAGSQVLVFRRFDSILHATRKLAKGELDVRITPEAGSHGSGEFDQLAAGFDEMAANLQNRTRQLEAAEAKYRSLVEQIPAITYVTALDKVGGTFYVSPQVVTILGVPRAEWAADPELWVKFIHPDDRERVSSELQRSGVDGFRSKYRMITARGREVWIRDQAIVVRDEDGPRFLQGVMMDVTDQVYAKRAIEHLSRENEYILNSAGEGIMGLDPEGKVTFINPAALNILGRQGEVLTGQRIQELIQPAKSGEGPCWPKVCFVPDESGASSARILEEDFFRRKDGTPFAVEYVITPIVDDEGKPVGTVVVFRDVTESKRAKEELLLLATAVKQAAESIVITDRAGIIHYVNPSFERISGFSREEVMGKSHLLLSSGIQDGEFLQSMWNSLKRGEIWTGPISNARRDGTPYELESTISPVRNESGKVTHFVAVMRDVTHEASLETQLRQAQKMEAIGTLAGGIAHDFNNILTAIIGFAEMAAIDADNFRATRVHLDQVLQAGNRARELVKQILTFSRRSEQQLRPVRLSLIINETMRFLRASLPSTIEITQDIQAERAVVLADPTQVHQILMNLCSNAEHAMRENGGRLHIGLVEVDLLEEDLPRFQELQPGRYVRLEVGDTGKGMDRAVMERIFEPFFTTKGAGEGTGMGLAVVHGIVKGLGGTVSAFSEPGKGSTFQILLPSVVEESAIQPELVVSMRGGSERILLVDDEEILVQLEQELLERLGYEVVARTNSVEALEAFTAGPDAFDLLITDQTMPQLTGVNLSKEVLRIRPDLPIILCTGFSGIITREEARLLGIRELVLKPVSVREMAEAIRRVLDTAA